LTLAGQSECLKQDLASSYDFNLENLYNELDDCNLKFIDSSALKRYLIKCSIYPTDALLIAIIRRLDLDADARLSKREFFDGLMPIENYTKGSLQNFKKATKRPKSSSFARVTRHGISLKPSPPNPMANTLHG
jgi:hypothetical protein